MQICLPGEWNFHITSNLKKCTPHIIPPLCEIYTIFFLFPYTLGHEQQNIKHPLKKIYQFKQNQLEQLKIKNKSHNNMVNNSNGFFFNARKNVHLSKVKVLLTQVERKQGKKWKHRHTHTYRYKNWPEITGQLSNVFWSITIFSLYFK